MKFAFLTHILGGTKVRPAGLRHGGLARSHHPKQACSPVANSGQTNGPKDASQAPDTIRDKDEHRDIKERLRKLGGELEKVRDDERTEDSERSRGKPSGQALGKALRLGTELVAGVAVGAFIGWWLDRFFETWPVWFLIFFALGAAAGILNVFRTARRLQEKELSTGIPVQDLPDDDDD